MTLSPDISAAESTSAVGRIHIEPAKRCKIDHCPVMASGIPLIELVAGFPAGRDAKAAAERDEHQSLQSAVALAVHGCVFAEVLNGKIAADEGVGHLRRDVFIDGSRLFKRSLTALRDLKRKILHEGSEADVRLLLGKILRFYLLGGIRLVHLSAVCGNGLLGPKVMINALYRVLVLHEEIVILPDVLLIADGALRSVLVCKKVMVGRGLEDLNIGDIAAGADNRDVNLDFAGAEGIVVHAERETDAEAPGVGAVLLHVNERLPERVAWSRFGCFRAQSAALFLAGCMLDVVPERAGRAVDKVLLAVYVDPVDASLVLKLAELLRSQILDDRLRPFIGFFEGIRVIRRKSLKNLTLDAKLGF